MAGRPEITFDEKDLAVVETFGKIKASYDLMADHFGCSSKTIERRMADEDGEFCRCYKRGLEETITLLAQKQIAIALGGNVTMLIWLGKQYLGQTDKQDLTSGGSAISGFEIKIVNEVTKGNER